MNPTSIKNARQIFLQHPPPLDAAEVVGEISEAEPIKVDDSEAAPPRRFVYEYHLRDHQGNLRVAFRAETGQRTLHLTMEHPGKKGVQEEGKYPLFENVTSTRDAGGVSAYQGSYTAAVAAERPGPTTTLPVAEGDVVKLALYYRTPSGTQYLRPAAGASAPALAPTTALRLLPALLPALGTAGARPDGTPAPTAPALGLQLRLLGGLGGGRAARQRQRLAQAADAAALRPLPAPAYVLWTLVDEEGQELQRAATPVPVQSLTAWTPLSATFRVKPGTLAGRRAFLRMELLNEGKMPVYFDSLTLRHPRPALYISQENHYYPFGMALSGAAANTVPAEAISKAQYNGGSTLEDELTDPESANYATPYRRYDPTIGRLLGIDPLADQYADLSPGHFAFNDPVNFQDPSGADGSPADEAVRIAGLMGSSTLVYASGGDGGGGFGEGTRSGTNYVRNDAGELVNPFQWSYTYTTGTGGTDSYLSGIGGGGSWHRNRTGLTPNLDGVVSYKDYVAASKAGVPGAPYMYKLNNKMAYVKPEDGGGAVPIPPQSVYFRRIDGVATESSGVFKTPDLTSVVIRPDGQVYFVNDLMYNIHKLRSADMGRKDLSWFAQRQADKDHGWDALFSTTPCR